MKKCLFIFSTVLLFALNSVGSQLSDTLKHLNTRDYRWERLSVSLGAFLNTMNSDLQLGSRQLGLGITVNLENALGLETTTFVMKGDAEYNFGKKMRGSVRLGYVGINRKAYKTLESEIEIGDQVYDKGVYVTSVFNIMIIRALYDYSFYRDERAKIGVSGGFYVMPVSFSIKYLNIQKAEIIAPLPVLGIRSRFQISPKVVLNQSVEIFYLELSNFKGSISDINISLDYKPFQHFGAGIGFNSFRFNLEGTKNSQLLGDIEGTIKSGIAGAFVYLKYFF